MDNGRRTHTLQKEVLINAENRKTNRNFVVILDRTGRLWFCLERRDYSCVFIIYNNLLRICNFNDTINVFFANMLSLYYAACRFLGIIPN